MLKSPSCVSLPTGTITFYGLPADGCCCWRYRCWGPWGPGTGLNRFPLIQQGRKNCQQSLLLVTGEKTLLLQGGLGRRGLNATEPPKSHPSSFYNSTPQPAPEGPWSLLSPTSIRFLSLSSSCRRWVSRSPSSFRASSCRRLSSWFRSFSRVALRCIWRRETTMWKPGHRGHRCGAAQRQRGTMRTGLE